MFAAVLAKVNQWHWTKEIIYKINFLEHRLKNFLFAGDCIFIEPEHKARKIKVDYKWQRIENSWKRGPVCENWSEGSGLVVRYVLLTQVTQMQFVGPNPQVEEYFWDFMILFDSPHDLEKKRSWFWKLKLGFWTYGLIPTSSGLNWPKSSFLGPRPQSLKLFLDRMILLNSTHEFWENEVLILKIKDRILGLWADTSSGPTWPKCSF